MSDETKQDTLSDVTGKTVTVWADATGQKQHHPDATDGYGCVINDEDSNTKNEIQGEIEYENHHTAPVAKYKTIINGIKYVYREYSGVDVIQIYSDDKVVVDQINGISDTNQSHLQGLKKEAHRLLFEFDEWHVDCQTGKSSEIERAEELAEDSIKGDGQ